MLKEWCSKYTVSIKRIIRCQQIFWQFGIILVSQSSFLITPSLQRDFRLILLFSHSSLWWEYLFLTFQFLVVSLFVFACSHALCTITISSYSTFQWYHSAISFLFNVIISLFLSFQGYYLSLPFYCALHNRKVWRSRRRTSWTRVFWEEPVPGFFYQLRLRLRLRLLLLFLL